MPDRHRLLERQLKRAFTVGAPRKSTPGWEDFLERVDEAYRQSDTDRGLLERALDLSSNELLETNAQMRALLQAFPDIFFRLDCEGTILECRAGDSMDLCLEASALIGRRIQDCPRPEVGAEFERSLERVTSASAMVAFEYALAPDGREEYYEARVVPLPQQQLLAVVRNISRRKQFETALVENERDYRGLFEAAHDAILLLHPVTWEVLQVNERACRLYGYQRQQFTGRSFRDIDSDPEMSYSVLLGTKPPEDETGCEALHTRADGSEMCLEIHASMVRYNGADAILSINRDITERERAKEDLEGLVSLLEATLDSTADGILVVDANRKIVTFNRQFEEMWRLPDTVIESRDNDKTLRHALDQLADPETFLAKVEELYETPAAESHDLLELKDSRVFERFSTPQRIGSRIVGRVWSFRDVTERLHAEKTIRHLAYHDELTGLPNRLMLGDRLEQLLAQAERAGEQAALLFLDIDRFKKINDTLGHAVGDELLREVAGRLRSSARRGETIGRLGGDEFMVLAHDVRSAQQAEGVAKRLIETLREPFELSGNTLHVTASVGISLFPSDGEDSESLVKYADVAMYEAKNGGRNNYRFYDSVMNARALEELTLETDLRRAIDNDELMLEFQPQIELATGNVMAAEALVRWRLPDGTFRPPHSFVGAAEGNGLIVPMGQWVFEAACREACLWQQKGKLPVRVAINVSARQIERRDFLDQTQYVLSNTGLDPSCVELELTESALMNDLERGVVVLERLRDLGVTISLDDFGTGHSSLSLVAKLPLSKLKIDRSFVRDCARDTRRGAIVTSIISMGQSLGLRVIAEGVETEDELNFLSSHGCDAVQGFHFSPPVAAADFMNLLTVDRAFPRPSSRKFDDRLPVS